MYILIVFGTDGSDSIFVAIFIIGRLCVGRLLGTLDFRAISSRARSSGVFGRAALGLVTILVFGVPVVGVFYISKLS